MPCCILYPQSTTLFVYFVEYTQVKNHNCAVVQQTKSASLLLACYGQRLYSWAGLMSLHMQSFCPVSLGWLGGLSSLRNRPRALVLQVNKHIYQCVQPSEVPVEGGEQPNLCHGGLVHTETSSTAITYVSIVTSIALFPSWNWLRINPAGQRMCHSFPYPQQWQEYSGYELVKSFTRVPLAKSVCNFKQLLARAWTKAAETS